MILSPHEIAYFAITEGFKVSNPPKMDDEAVRFTAICLAESAGDTEAMGRSTSGASVGNHDHGLAQVSGKWHWDAIQATGGRWRDPAVNVAIAYGIFVARNRAFTDWSTFNSGRYSEFIPDALIAAAHPWAPVPYPSWVDELARRMENT